MESEVIATNALSILFLHFCTADRTVTDKNGTEMNDRLRTIAQTLHETIKNKFSFNEYNNKTFKRLEEKPDDKDRQFAMKSVLKEVISEDQKFQENLSQLLVEIQPTGVENVIQVGNGGAANHGGVASGAHGISVGGNMYFYGYEKAQSKGTDRFYIFFSCEHVPSCERMKIGKEQKPKCCFKNAIENDIPKNWEIKFKGRLDFHNSIIEVYKTMNRYNKNSIFIFNPYQKQNDINYFQLGYALGKEMEILGVFDKDGYCVMEEIKSLDNVDVVTNMDEFCEKLGEKLNKIKPIRSISSKVNSNMINDLYFQ